MTHCVWKKHTVYKGTLSGVLFALIVREKILPVNFFTLALLLKLWTNIRYASETNWQWLNLIHNICQQLIVIDSMLSTFYTIWQRFDYDSILQTPYDRDFIMTSLSFGSIFVIRNYGFNGLLLPYQQYPAEGRISSNCWWWLYTCMYSVQCTSSKRIANWLQPDARNFPDSSHQDLHFCTLHSTA